MHMNSLIISSKNSFVQNVDLRGMSECRNCLRLQNRRAQERKKEGQQIQLSRM